MPLVPTVARLYVQNGYRRASTKPGPGTPLVQLADAQAAIDAWRQRVELRQVALAKSSSERDLLLAAAIEAACALSQVTPTQCYPEAISAYAKLQSVIAILT
ncbi:hypothetical protein [Ottowia sp. VDI28]|uniref:hypothetical protein n=1 Tax=Ottowia sp. VDI28 TaxID=3133968 RepID=UPI003C2B7A4D